MKEHPQYWVNADLGDIADFVMGQAPPGTSYNSDGVGTPLVKAGEFGPERPVFDNWTTEPLKIAKETDVLICVVGATSGKINLGADCAIGRSVAAIRPTEALDQLYLYNFLKTRVLPLRSVATGTAQGVISKVVLHREKIPLPRLVEQKRIVRKLDTLSARTSNARTHLTAIAKLVEKYKTGVLAAAFSGHEVSAKFGSLIDGIKAGKNLKCDERPPEEGERGTVKVSAVTWGEFRPDQSKTYPAHFEPDPDTVIKPGDFLFSRANTIELVGAVVIVEQTPGNLFLSDKVLRIDMSEDLKPWLMWFLRSPQGRNQLEDISSGNQQSMRNIGQAKLKTVDVPLPDEDTRTRILGTIRSSFERIDRLQTEAEKALWAAERLEERILAKAFAGKLVPQDPNDEPASELLDRIREARANAPKKTRPRRTKATAMKKDPKDLLLADSAKWPANGVVADGLAKKVGLAHDDLRDALFELLGGTKPQLEQVFDKTEKQMRLKRVAQ